MKLNYRVELQGAERSTSRVWVSEARDKRTDVSDLQAAPAHLSFHGVGMKARRRERDRPKRRKHFSVIIPCEEVTPRRFEVISDFSFQPCWRG